MITHVRCSGCVVEVPVGEVLEHFSHCGTWGAPLIEAVVAMARDDKRHVGYRLTTTMANDCPRRVVLSRTYDVAVDLEEIMPPALGSLMHAGIARVDHPDWISERCTCAFRENVDRATREALTFSVVDGQEHEPHCAVLRCTVAGTVLGHEISGRIDAMHVLERRGDRLRVDAYDWKFTSAYNARYIEDGVVKSDHTVQAVINTELARQNGIDIASYQFDVVPWYNVKPSTLAPVPPPAALTSLYPFDGNMSAATLLNETARAFTALNNGEEPRTVIQSLPYAGREMMKDKRGGCMCTKACAYRGTCYAVGGTADAALPPNPFPF